MKPVKLTPLTAEERDFAEEHHDLVFRYLAKRNLSQDEWYDVVALSYLRSVKKWFARPDLWKYRFSTIAFDCMWSAVGAERRRRSRRIEAAVSLDEGPPGTEGLTYGDTVTYENLRYVPYIETRNEGGTMDIKYNVKLPERKSNYSRQKSDETLAVESFLAGNMKNMCFEYENEGEAKKKYSSVRSSYRTKGHQERYDLFRDGIRIYFVRKEAKKQDEKSSRRRKGADLGSDD